MGVLPPDLERLHSDYQNIYEQVTNGTMALVVARARLERLSGFDDHGRAWRISPETGRWTRWEPASQTWVDDDPTVGTVNPDTRRLPPPPPQFRENVNWWNPEVVIPENAVIPEPPTVRQPDPGPGGWFEMVMTRAETVHPEQRRIPPGSRNVLVVAGFVMILVAVVLLGLTVLV